MSRTKKGSKPPGFEFWGKRGAGKNPMGAWGFGKIAKLWTKRAERKQDKSLIEDGLKDLNDKD